jgi:hypothetical protein
MMWLFSRRKEEIRLETWYDKHTSEFVVDIAHPDEHTESKRFLNDRVFQTWLTTWGGLLAGEGWTQSGPFLSVPERHATQTVDSPVAGSGDTMAVDDAIAKRRYTTRTHDFEVTLSRISLKEHTVWTVALVVDAGRAGKRLSIAGMQAVASSTPDTAFASACDRIDKWLLANSKA